MPPAGAELGAVTVESVDGRTRTLPDGAVPVVVVYEDRDAGAQNKHVKPLLDRVARDVNKGKAEVVAVGDVSAYDFWPAKRFVQKHIREQQAADRSTIWLDWKGAVRKRWSLTARKSGILLVDTSGRVRFAAEGPLSQEQLEALRARLLELGCQLD